MIGTNQISEDDPQNLYYTNQLLNVSETQTRDRIMSNDFYLRYYVGHKGKFGHEFLEFEFRPDGKLRFVSLGLDN